MSAAGTFHRTLASGVPILSTGVYDCVSAICAERAGFTSVSISGAAVAASVLGYPDLGLLTLTEAVNQARNIARSVDIPVLVDADTGYGNALNVMRTVREFEDAGLAGVSIEDQTFPKRCGHYDGIALIAAEEMAVKVRAACEARRHADFVIMARTDARSVEGLDGAIERACRYADAGADMIFVESLADEAEMRKVVAQVPRPLKINLLEGGKTPRPPFAHLFELGFRLVNYSGLLQRAAIRAMDVALEVLRRDGVTAGLYPDRIVNLAERNALLRLESFYALEERLYGPLLHDDRSWRAELQESTARSAQGIRKSPI
jgi:2-methylisocitrate lyase-like PEP mutase family enzyme